MQGSFPLQFPTLADHDMVFDQPKLRIWDHLPVVLKIDTKELRVKKKSDDEKKLKFQELVLCSNGSRDWVNDEEQGELDAYR